MPHMEFSRVWLIGHIFGLGTNLWTNYLSLSEKWLFNFRMEVPVKNQIGHKFGLSSQSLNLCKKCPSLNNGPLSKNLSIPQKWLFKVGIKAQLTNPWDLKRPHIRPFFPIKLQVPAFDKFLQKFLNLKSGLLIWDKSQNWQTHENLKGHVLGFSSQTSSYMNLENTKDKHLKHFSQP